MLVIGRSSRRLELPAPLSSPRHDPARPEDAQSEQRERPGLGVLDGPQVERRVRRRSRETVREDDPDAVDGEELSPAAHYGYLALYIAGYITDDALMVGAAVWALSSSKLSAGAGRWLKLVSGLVMALLGVLMLVKPEWLF